MQSILQYRRFERRLREQIQRHGVAEISGCNCPNSESSSATRARASSLNLENGSAALEKSDERDEETESTDFDRNLKQNTDVAPKDLSGSASRESGCSSSSSQPRRPALSAVTTRSANDEGIRLGVAMTGVDVRTRYTNEGSGEKGKVFIVGFAGEDDPLDPHNWSVSRRMATTIMVAFIGLIVGLASSIDSAVINQAKVDLGVSEVVESLATGLYLVGFGCGAFFAAPISETVGRNPVYVATMLLFIIFIMASGLSPNIGAQLTFRFLAGFFGSTPLTCAGGSISDMWSPSERTAVFPIFANSAFWGPLLGPIIGGFIGQASSDGIISWRWSEWVTLIWSGLILFFMAFFMPETYAPTLLKWKASHLRKITGDSRYVSQLEVQDTKFGDRLIHNLYRPFILFAYEPIVVLFTLYLTVVYIVLFTFLTGFEFIFTETFGLNQGLTFLCFLGIGVGFCGASALVPWVFRRYKRALAEVQRQGGTRLNPEQRLVFAMFGAPALPLGLFWMAWTAYPSIGPWSCIMSTIPIGFAIMGIFISTYQYLIDSFEVYAASALVGATFVRYVVAGGMIEVSIPMYQRLGVHWTLTVLGLISLLMTPVPFVFFKFGPIIRKHSRHAAEFGVGN